MDKVIKDSLQLLTLSPKEIAFFYACFTLGTTTVTEVAKKARLERSTAYLIANNLLKEGLLIEDYNSYRKSITTVSPQKLLVKVAARQRLLHKQELTLKEHLVELEAMHLSNEVKPSIKFFQGSRGLRAVWQDVLTTKEEILLWTNQEKESQVFTKEFHDQFIQERISKRIPIRTLAVNNILGKKLLEKDESSLRHSKLLPIHTSFNAETYLYDNKIATLDYKKDIIGIIIESEAISSTQKAIFEMTWNSL